MTKQLISSGSSFEKDVAYSRAVVVDKMVFVSGCTGYNYSTMAISDTIEAQCEQTFLNIISALEKAGSSLKDVVRVHYILPDPKDFEACWPILRKYFDDIRPAATMFCAQLSNATIKIEIEVTAMKSEA
jgi:enamine deaminase RidA (YjgF/YER057c/UK114 family)